MLLPWQKKSGYPALRRGEAQLPVQKQFIVEE